MVRSVRTVLAVVLLALGCLSIPLSPTAWWVQTTVMDTDEFVATLAPLASDPEFQELVAGEIVAQVMASVDGRGVPSVVAERIERSVARVAQQVVAGPRFERAWERALTEVHPELVAVLRDDQEPDALVAVDDDGTVVLRVQTLADTVRDALEEAGVPGAALLPDVDVAVPVTTVDQLTATQAAYEPIDRWGAWFAPGTVLLLVAAIVVAPARRATTLAAALGALVVLLLSQLAVSRGQDVAVAHVPAEAVEVGDTALSLLTDPLRSTLGVLAVAAVAAVALLLLLQVVVSWRRRPATHRPPTSYDAAPWDS